MSPAAAAPTERTFKILPFKNLKCTYEKLVRPYVKCIWSRSSSTYGTREYISYAVRFSDDGSSGSTSYLASLPSPEWLASVRVGNIRAGTRLSVEEWSYAAKSDSAVAIVSSTGGITWTIAPESCPYWCCHSSKEMCRLPQGTYSFAPGEI